MKKSVNKNCWGFGEFSFLFVCLVKEKKKKKKKMAREENGRWLRIMWTGINNLPKMRIYSKVFFFSLFLENGFEFEDS